MGMASDLQAKITSYYAETHPTLVTAFDQISKAVNLHESLYGSVCEVTEFLKPGRFVDPNTANKLLDKCKGFKNIMANRKAIHRDMCSEKGCSDEVYLIGEEALREAANKVLKQHAYVGATHLFNTFAALWGLLLQIIKADILANKTIAETKKIEKQLEAVPPKLQELANILLQLQKEETTPDEIKRFYSLQQKLADSIEFTLTRSEATIMKLLQSNEQVRTALEKSRRNASEAGVVGMVGGVAAVANTGLLLTVACPPLLFANVVLGAANFILGGIAMQKAKCAEERINAIVSYLKKLKAMQSAVAEYQRELRETKEKISKIMFSFGGRRINNSDLCTNEWSFFLYLFGLLGLILCLTICLW